jgi:molybdate transport system substrate-binding protein
MFFKSFVLVMMFCITSLEASQMTAPANIFAAGNNKLVLPALIQSFYKKYPDSRVVVQYGATGDLANSILNGVNYDIFLAADMKYPQKIYEAKKAINPPLEYARGSLILFVPADKTLHQRKVKLLCDVKIKNITIANKKTAPYGMAAVEALTNAKIFDSLQSKIRYSTDISTAITNVIWYDDAGFLSKSALNSLPAGYREEGVNWIEVDKELYAPIIQGYVISENGVNNVNVKRFVEFLFSAEGRKIYKEYGYE